MPIDQSKLKRQLKQKQKPPSSTRTLEFAIISLLLVVLIAIFGFIWHAVSLRQSEPIAARADVVAVPATSTPEPAPQSWYVVVTPVPPRPTAIPRYDYSASSDTQSAAAPVYAPSDTQVCAGAVTAHCSQMTSCEQALACLRLGNPNIDGDRDGWPCERQWCGRN